MRHAQCAQIVSRDIYLSIGTCGIFIGKKGKDSPTQPASGSRGQRGISVTRVTRTLSRMDARGQSIISSSICRGARSRETQNLSLSPSPPCPCPRPADIMLAVDEHREIITEIDRIIVDRARGRRALSEFSSVGMPGREFYRTGAGNHGEFCRATNAERQFISTRIYIQRAISSIRAQLRPSRASPPRNFAR